MNEHLRHIPITVYYPLIQGRIGGYQAVCQDGRRCVRASFWRYGRVHNHALFKKQMVVLNFKINPGF